MIVHDLNVVGVVALPAKTDAPLIVYPNAVLACTIATQKFEPVTRRYAQIVECRCCIQYQEFSQRGSL